MTPAWRRLIRPALLAAFFGLAAAAVFWLFPEREEVSPQSDPQPELVLPRVQRVEEVFPPRSTLEDVLLERGFTRAEVHGLIQDSRAVYNLNRVMAGHRFALERWPDGSFKQLEYDISDEEYLVIRPADEGYRASRHPYRFEVVEDELYGEIEESLWKTLIDAGETDQLVLALSRVLRWDIDFTAIHPRDSFRLIVEKKFLNDEFVKYGRILGVEFETSGRSFYAFLFRNPESGRMEYFDERGRPVRKAFLKVPFSFDPRITSGFSHSRYHPILKRRRPHLGVDYGAPPGTPVLASASGRVVFVGRDGGFGNLVRVRHPNGYTTAYAHLSRILVRSGQKVSQGDWIGRVGATGLATGPHLDYRVQDSRGRYINPRAISALPSDKPLERKHLRAFAWVRDKLTSRLAAIQPAPAGISQAD